MVPNWIKKAAQKKLGGILSSKCMRPRIESVCESSKHQCYDLILCILFDICGLLYRLVSANKCVRLVNMGSIMRDITKPRSRFMLPAWFIRQYCLLLHLISVRTCLVRSKYYYILCLNTNYIQYIDTPTNLEFKISHFLIQ